MIDLHTHILPGVDDGATDLEMALAMGRFAADGGITTIAVTPHFYEIPKWSLVQEKVAELRRAFEEAQIAVELVPGAELLLDMDLLDMSVQDIPTYGDQGRFCLVEFPLQQMPIYAEQVLFGLQAKGLTPIIAHPERYGAVMENPNLVLDWLRQGCLIQMNTGSILGRFGPVVQETAMIMLRSHMVQVVASDAHGSVRRRLNLPETFSTLVEIVGESTALDLVQTNPQGILRGDFRLKTEPIEYRKKRRSFFSRLGWK